MGTLADVYGRCNGGEAMRDWSIGTERPGVPIVQRILVMLLVLAGAASCAPNALMIKETIPTIATEQAVYIMTENPLGFSEFFVEATFRNDFAAPAELRLCQHTPPLYWLEKHTPRGWERVYDPMCYAVGSSAPELIPPGGTRTDTLHVRHHRGAIPRFRVEHVTGDYRLAYPVFLRTPSTSTPHDTVAYSNVFRVHLSRETPTLREAPVGPP
jgi:hypothetical protein